ncbi:YebC/PmpR family DNA-binding transcriptional regulator [Ketobacter alkanivorans]|uniref:Probable transcriptional regulatory protein Kalk_19920 n=1 Tax=Ketobacter alkanivorans TaxID=1917421 RepID=A0A2K9LQM5_9GAMM|nr:YebC/PmpR family DNA-binding transcriptional regulator [Ketobacter alkanivorans]AUM14557.1 YebC/PmpR family DNA-binding transcriptional regulator [Ketobacter alkanivorans]MCP5013976.1 YebC/PmpR family DNA-binding transcriptional regulator [Ketobacter sp.]
MAGHSKWANIKHRKAAQDAKRGKIFTRLIREITIAARAGGAPEDNPRLRLAMDKALAANMTKDTIERAIKRGAGGEDGTQLDELTYEGYGVGGVAVIVETMTDNRNRTAGEVRHAFSKHGGNLGTDGSVAYLFSKRGEIGFDPGADEDAIMEAALEAGAEDVVSHTDGSIEVITAWEDLGKVKSALDAAGLQSASAELNMAASVQVDMDVETATTVLKMIDMLEELDDVQNVFTNANFTQELMEQMDS